MLWTNQGMNAQIRCDANWGSEVDKGSICQSIARNLSKIIKIELILQVIKCIPNNTLAINLNNLNKFALFSPKSIISSNVNTDFFTYKLIFLTILFYLFTWFILKTNKKPEKLTNDLYLLISAVSRKYKSSKKIGIKVIRSINKLDLAYFFITFSFCKTAIPLS